MTGFAAFSKAVRFFLLSALCLAIAGEYRHRSGPPRFAGVSVVCCHHAASWSSPEAVDIPSARRSDRSFSQGFEHGRDRVGLTLPLVRGGKHEIDRSFEAYGAHGSTSVS